MIARPPFRHALSSESTVTTKSFNTTHSDDPLLTPPRDEEKFEFVVVTPEDEGRVLPPMDGGVHAWRFCLIGLGLEILIWGPTFSFGAFQEFYASPNSGSPFSDTSHLTLSAIGTTALALNYGLMLPGLVLCRRYSKYIKSIMWASCGFYAASFIAASFATQVWHLILFQGVGCGLFGGILYSPIYVLLGEWFDKRKGLAGGIIFSGSCFGGAVFPLMIGSLLERGIDFRWILRIFALLVVVVGGVAVWFVERRVEKDDEGRKGDVVRGEKNDGWFLVDPVFVLFATIIALQGSIYSSLAVYLPTYSVHFTTPFNASLALSVLNLFAAFGQTLFGIFCDEFDYRWGMFGSLLLSVVGILGVLRGTEGVPGVMGFAAFMGLFAGGFASCWFAASTSIAGAGHRAQSGTIFGSIGIIRGLAAILGPLISGTLIAYPSSHSSTPSSAGGSAGGMEESVWGKYGYAGFVLFCGWGSLVTAGVVLGMFGVERWRKGRN